MFNKFFKKSKRWWFKSGGKWITIETVCITIFALVVIYFLFTAKKEYIKCDVLTEDDLDYVEKLPVKKIKIFKPKNVTKKKVWKKEEKCRQILEKIYNKTFPSVRPDFLKSPATGKNLELDCYNSEMKLALEYDGSQHSKYNPYFHRKGVSDFSYQVARDQWKDIICKKEGITLIRVPHWVIDYDLESYIRGKLKDHGKL